MLDTETRFNMTRDLNSGDPIRVKKALEEYKEYAKEIARETGHEWLWKDYCDNEWKVVAWFHSDVESRQGNPYPDWRWEYEIRRNDALVHEGVLQGLGCILPEAADFFLAYQIHIAEITAEVARYVTDAREFSLAISKDNKGEADPPKFVEALRQPIPCEDRGDDRHGTSDAPSGPETLGVGGGKEEQAG